MMSTSGRTEGNELSWYRSLKINRSDGVTSIGRETATTLHDLWFISERLRQAIENDISDAKSQCGGDGLGCETFRQYYDNVERRYKKCGSCPMNVLANVRAAIAIKEGDSP